MRYALNLAEDKRILSSCLPVYRGQVASDRIVDEVFGSSYYGMPIVGELPDGNLPDYLYIEEKYVYDPLPQPEQPEPVEEPTVWDELDAAYQSGYTEGYQEGVDTAYDE